MALDSLSWYFACYAPGHKRAVSAMAPDQQMLPGLQILADTPCFWDDKLGRRAAGPVKHHSFDPHLEYDDVRCLMLIFRWMVWKLEDPTSSNHGKWRHQLGSYSYSIATLVNSRLFLVETMLVPDHWFVVVFSTVGIPCVTIFRIQRC